MFHTVPSELHLETPYLCGHLDQCSEENFDDYPDLHGFDIDSITTEGQNLAAEDLDKLAAFLQAWLVFGLLRKLLSPSDIELQLSDFVIKAASEVADQAIQEHPEHHDGSVFAEHKDDLTASTLYISMKKLPLYMVYWFAKEYDDDQFDRREKAWQQHSAVFVQVNSVVNKLITWRRKCYAHDAIDEEDLPVLDLVILSIVLLSEYLIETCRAIFSTMDWYLDWNLDNALHWYLMDAGWCQGEITSLHQNLIHSTSIYLISYFDRHCLDRDHSRCTESACVANNLNEATYETKHATAGCSCSHVGEVCGAAALVSEMLTTGDVPVIRVQGSTAISIQKSSESSYVAISHVWSHGLGNPNNNTLPSCQLQRLQGYVNALYPQGPHPIPFWIDTICVPRRPDLRRKAISLMAKTYEDADKVLVIDEWLIQSTFVPSSELNMLKIKACDWTKRVWTLQESVLAQENQLHVQFATTSMTEKRIVRSRTQGDGTTWTANLVGSGADTLFLSQRETASAILEALQPNAVKAKVDDAPADDELSVDNGSEPARANFRKTLIMIDSWYIHNFIWVEGRDFFLDMRFPRGRNNRIMEANTMMMFGYSLRSRTTSRAVDEPVCFATLLKQDLEAVLDQSSAQDRMTVVAKRMKNAPVKLLFSSMARIDKPGLRWAPLSFRLGTSSGKFRSPGVVFTRIGKVRSAGLLVDLEGLAVEGIRDADRLQPEFRLRTASRAFLVRIGEHIGKATAASAAGGNLVLVLAWPSDSLTHPTRSKAILVQETKSVRKTTFAALLAVCVVIPEDELDASDQVLDTQLDGRLLTQRQWCIG